MSQFSDTLSHNKPENSQDKHCLHQKQQSLRKLKVNLVLSWTEFVLTPEHRCFMGIVCSQWFGHEKACQMTLFQCYHNYRKYIDTLVEACLVKIENKTSVYFNPAFFTILPLLIAKISQKIGPQLQVIEKFAKKVNVAGAGYCSNCGAQSSEEEGQVLGWTCKCVQPKFILFNDPACKARFNGLKAFRQNYQIILMSKQKIDRQQEQLITMKKNLASKKIPSKISQFDSFVQKQTQICRQLKIPIPNQTISPQYIQECQQLYGQKQIFSNLEKMKRTKEQRLIKKKALKSQQPFLMQQFQLAQIICDVDSQTQFQTNRRQRKHHLID